jgi:hypothetical protein
MRHAAGQVFILLGLAGFIAALVVVVRLLRRQPGVWRLQTRKSAVWAVVASVVVVLIGGGIYGPDEATDSVTATAGADTSSTTATTHVPTTVRSTVSTSNATSTTAKPTTTTHEPKATITTRKPKVTTTTQPIAEADRKGDSRNPGQLYPDRPDIEKDDHERPVGDEPVRFAGWSTYVTSVAVVRNPTEFDRGTFLRVHVKLLNRDKDQQDWMHDDWSLIYPSGEVYSPATVLADGSLGISGGLVHGGTVEGDVWFDTASQTGNFYVTWVPSNKLTHPGRGVWRVTR